MELNRISKLEMAMHIKQIITILPRMKNRNSKQIKEINKKKK